jgi:uncharacterized protein YuzE
MLYINLIDRVSTESEEVAPGIVLDFGERDQVVGIEIEDASKCIDMSRLDTEDPNETTRQALEDALNRRNLVSFKSAEALFADLGI